MGVLGWGTVPMARRDRRLKRFPDAHVRANHFWFTARQPR